MEVKTSDRQKILKTLISSFEILEEKLGKINMKIEKLEGEIYEKPKGSRA